MSKTLRSFFIIYLMIGTVSLLDLPFISDVQDIIGLAHDIGDIASGNIPFKGFFVATVNPINVIMDTVNQLVDQVTTLGKELNGKLDSILNAILVRVPLEGKIDDDMKEIVSIMSRIDRKYEDFEIYAEFPEDYSERSLRAHINYVTGNNVGELQDLLYSMLNIIVPPKSALTRASLLENIRHLRNISDNTELCDLDVSFQHRLYKIYNLFMITELKAFIMTEFAYKQLEELEKDEVKTIHSAIKKGAYIGEIKRTQAKYIMRACQYQIEVKKIMQGASRDIFRCGPKKLVARDTHTEFENLFSSVVINEYQMSSCQGGCSDHGVLSSHERSYLTVTEGIYGSKVTHYYYINNICHGSLRDCGWIGGKVEMCENPEGSPKRYQYVKSAANGYYGEWTDCAGGEYKSLYTFTHNWRECENCYCTCFEDKADSTAIRAISLRPQKSNIRFNMVVSNVRFVEKNRMLHIQIQESPLLPVGRLNTNYSSWVLIGDFAYDANTTHEGAFFMKSGYYYKRLMKDVDYSFIKYDRRRFNLDEIIAPPGYVVTGVRFDYESFFEPETSPYHLELHVTPFNFTTGLLAATDENPSMWINANSQQKPPVEYYGERTVISGSTRVKFDDIGNFIPIPATNRYVELQRSDSTDGAQSTVPFFDTRPPVPRPNLAYDGIGFMYYESDKHAGIVGLKMTTIDLVSYVKPKLDGKQLKYYKKFYREPLRHNPAEVKETILSYDKF